MPQNPLLPNKKLQQLYATMLRARDSASSPGTGLEAILAAVTLLLEPGDAVISSQHNNLFAELLGPARRNQSAARSLTASANPLAFAGGVAAGLQVAGNSRLAIALLDGPGPEPAWPAILGSAQSDRSPLITICLDTPPQRTRTNPKDLPAALTWDTLNRAAKKLRFPILTVDGADAVAMVRALQESVLRARHGDGPALLWCLMPPPTGSRKTAGAAPWERLEHYLTARRIPLSRVPAPAPGRRKP